VRDAAVVDQDLDLAAQAREHLRIAELIARVADGAPARLVAAPAAATTAGQRRSTQQGEQGEAASGQHDRQSTQFPRRAQETGP
jgi:hypothetical protein